MTRRALRVLLCAAFMVPGAARGQTSPEGRAVFTVTTASNSAGPGPCTAASCTLNQAIQAANANPNGSQPDLIRFAVPGPETVSIAVTATEPVETITEGVEIDGYSQPGASPNTIPFGAGGLDSVLRVELLGTGRAPASPSWEATASCAASRSRDARRRFTCLPTAASWRGATWGRGRTAPPACATPSGY